MPDANRRGLGKVLAAIDFADSSLEALRQARALAHQVEGTLAVCHVLPAPHELHFLFPDPAPNDVPDPTREDHAVREALRERARSAIGLELTQIFVERGAAYAEIVRRAEAYAADFIVVGSHGRGGLARAMLGSVAERVVEQAHCSVLVARPAPSQGVVLVATDLSDPSMPAIRSGIAAAKRLGARLVVLSVLELLNSTLSSAGGLVAALPAILTPELQGELRATLRSMVEEALERAGGSGEVLVREGAPASEIVACAEDLGAELVVVGTRGRTGFLRLALGSVAQRVVRYAPCSVLAVRLAPAS